jgi:spore maturation protein SpmA
MNNNIDRNERMILLGNVLVLLVLAMILVLAVYAIIRGCKGIKASSCFETSNKKIRISYLVLSILHLSAGIIITVGYVIVGVLIIISL